MKKKNDHIWIILNIILLHILSLSLSLSLSHTHTHTHILSPSLSLSPFFSLPLSLSNTHTLSLSLTFSLFLPLSLSLFSSFSFSLSLFLVMEDWVAWFFESIGELFLFQVLGWFSLTIHFWVSLGTQSEVTTFRLLPSFTDTFSCMCECVC